MAYESKFQRRCRLEINHGVLDLSRLRQFSTVARHLNITRAADELYLSQQAVSSAVRALERELGMELLARNGRQFRLTAAGEVIKEGTASIFDAVKDLVLAASAAAEGVASRFAIAHTVEVSDATVRDLADTLHASFPSVRVTAHRLLADEIVPALRSGRADLAIRYGMQEEAGLDTADVGRSAVQVAFPIDHRLAQKESISIDGLAEDTLLLSGDCDIAEQLLWLCRASGYEPAVATTNIRGTSLTAELIHTGYFALVTEPPGTYHNNRVVVLPLENAPSIPLRALWIRHADTPLHRAVLDSGGSGK